MTRHPSLRTYLAVFAVVLTVATAAVLSWVTQEAATRQLERQIGESLTRRAQGAAQRLERGLSERRQDIELQVRALADESLHVKPAVVRKRLDALSKTSASYAWIGYANAEGKVLAASRGLLEGEDVSRRPWFNGASKAAFMGDVHGALLLEKHLQPSGGEPLRFMDVAMPVYGADGGFIGVLGAHIDWRWVRDAASSALDGGQRAETVIVSMADKVLLGPDGLQDATLSLDGVRRARRGEQGYRIERWPDGETYLAGYATSRETAGFSGLGWVVMVRERLDDAYAPVRELQMQFLFVGTAIAALFALVGWGLAVHITRPLMTISNAALAMLQGQSRVAIPISRRFREVAVLSHSLSRLVDTLMQRETQLEHQARHQSATGLPNRTHLTALLDQAIGTAGAADRQLAVLVFSLDRFNTITDVLDNESGDAALREMVGRMQSCIDGACLLGHLDREEFAVVFDGRKALLARALALATRLQHTLAEPVRIDGFDFSLTASVGISVYPDDGAHAATLLRHAEAALQQAHMRGGSRVDVYEAQAHARTLESLAIERDLRRALENREFELFYQPQFSVERNAIVGVEALIRWRHPERGMVSPALFIPAAEASGLIVPIGDWVLEEACAQARRWREQGLPELVIGVNVSARQFIGGDLVAKVSAAIAAHDLPPGQLKLEITESMMMQDVERGVAVMEELAALGVKISLDDFGTGYSSLSNLKRFPLAELKIDQSFVRPLAPQPDKREAAIIRAIIALGRDLGVLVTAEGVETQPQLEFLSKAGCDLLQGYHIGRPMPAADLATRLRG
jgi:diguanylate cyclase (GGDEF)-like protein